MKRSIGWLLVIAGCVVLLWGGFNLLTGSSQARMELAPNVTVAALPGGLIGLAVMTLGLIWVRD